ncbi:MAG: response regulator [Myxococcaceae bacterium]|nr:response regulator [Myxococcaceae bacterium]
MTAPRYTVLVVDDEAEVVETLKRNLRSEPYAVIGTTSPKEALAIVDAGGIDLVIADIDMPEMDGLSLVARIQRSHPDVIRILLTGDASLESAMTAINQGEVHRYLTKPWSTSELRDILRSALDRVTELRRASQISRDVAAREAFLLDLEKAHPGVRRVVREDGAYVIDAERMRDVARSLSDAKLRDLFDAEATRGPRRSEGTKRSQE